MGHYKTIFSYSGIPKYNQSNDWLPIPVATLCKAYACGRLPAEIVGSNPIRLWISVCCECCVLSSRDLCN